MAYRWINLIALLAAMLLPTAPVRAEAAKDSSLESLEKRSPGIIRSLLEQLDLTRPELKKIRTLYKQQEIAQAGYALLDYYQDNPRNLPWIAPDHYSQSPAFQKNIVDRARDNIFTLQGITTRQKTLSSGRIDWNDPGPKHDREWGWMLNRHLWFLDYVGYWSSTKKAEYIEAFDRQISDWILSNSKPPLWNPSNSPAWRALEVGRRLFESWPPAFFAFQKCPEFTPATRILMLASIHTQAEYCRRNLSSEGNHRNTELIGLASAAAYWPEFKKSKDWLDFAADQMILELSKRVYPDGAQMELSNHYQIVVATHCQTLSNFLHLARHPRADEVDQLSKKLWSYTQALEKPDGNGPLNNDAELEHNSLQISFNQRRSHLMKNTSGISALPSPAPASVYFPWAGHAIMRGTKGKDADWSFFDVGPLGTAHQHYDTLNFAVSSGGRDLLVDAGRYTYKPGKWRRYFTSQAAHNVVLFNGGGENEDPRQSRKPVNASWVSCPEFDFASGTTAIRLDSWMGTERVLHSRSVLYVRDQYWLVIDRIFPTRPYQIEVPWHFHPDCTVEIKNANISETVDKGRGNIRIIPIIPSNENFRWNARIVSGQTSPVVQGWYSPHYNLKYPSPVAIYTMDPNPSLTTSRPITFAWLLVPGKNIPNLQAEEIFDKYSPNGSLKIKISNPGSQKSDLVVFTPTGKKARVSLSLSNGKSVEIP